MINAYTKAMDSLFNYMIHPSYQYGQDGYVFSKLSREGFDSEYQDTFSNFILKIQDYCNSRDINFYMLLNLVRPPYILNTYQ